MASGPMPSPARMSRLRLAGMKVLSFHSVLGKISPRGFPRPLLRGSANASHLRMRTRHEGCSHLRLKKSCHCRGSPERASWINSLPHPEVRPPFDTCRPHPEVRGRSPSLEGEDGKLL